MALNDLHRPLIPAVFNAWRKIVSFSASCLNKRTGKEGRVQELHINTFCVAQFQAGPGITGGVTRRVCLMIGLAFIGHFKMMCETR